MKPFNHISTVPLFKALPLLDRRSLASIAGTRLYARGETIFSEGDQADRFYVVISGKVKIFKLSADGKEQILHIFCAGEPFGEAPVFSGKQFPASAEALEKTATLFFPRTAFVDLITSNPALALNMMAVLAERLHRFTDLIEQLSLREVPERLASYLLYRRSENGAGDTLELDLTKTQLASFLGTVPETLSRVLARMEKNGLISLAGLRTIAIRDAEGLDMLARTETRLR
jgi:CRP/FNR family transcriptional regulator, dissimilatory nitrate respiration regulator